MPKRKPSTHSLLYDLPRLYDILHRPGTKDEAEGLWMIARRWTGPGAEPRGLWLEPACGSCRHLRLASHRGIHCVGADLNPRMLRYARKLMSEREKKMIRLVHADMSDMDGVCKPGTVDFSFNMINTIRHLASDAAMLRHLRAIARALKPGGIYVVGMSLSNYEYETESEDRWEGSLGATTVIQNVQYLPAHGGKGVNGRKEKVISQILARRGSQEEHHDDVYFLRSYDLRQWVLLLEKSPLRLIATIDEKGEPIPPAEPGYTLFVLANKSDPRVADAVWHQGVG